MAQRGKRNRGKGESRERSEAHRRFRRDVTGLFHQESRHTSGQSSYRLTEGAKLYHGMSDLEETEETHVIPRESVTNRQFLKFFPIQSNSKIELRGKVAEKINGEITGRMIETSDAGYVANSSDPWKTHRSERSLLIEGTPKAIHEDRNLKRQTSRSKRIEYRIDDAPITDQKTPIIRIKK